MAKIIIRLPDLSDIRTLSPRPLRAAAVAAVSVIQRRAARGIDADGRPFIPYTSAYEEKKREAGRNTSPPDLTLTGQMLRSLKVKSATNDKDPVLLSPRVLIGVEGQHRDTRFARNEEAYDVEIWSSRDTRTRTLKDGSTIVYRQVVDKYRRNKSDVNGYTLERLASTTPMATIVGATHSKRPWFAVRDPTELAHLAGVFQRVWDEEVRKHNAQSKSRRTA